MTTTLIESISEPVAALTEAPRPALGARLLPLGQGTLLAAAFGVALGLGTLGGHVLGLALAVPLTFAASIAVAVPSLYVVLAMLEAPMDLGDLLVAASEAYRHSALVLGGLAPAMLLFSASISDRALVHFLGYAGLMLAAALGAYRLLSEARLALLRGLARITPRHWAVLLGFVGLTFELATRFWAGAVKVIGGLS